MGILLIPASVSGHGYIQSPRSRNFVGYEDGKYWPKEASDPLKEDCPHCLNLGGTLARCGMVGSRNYDYPKNNAQEQLPMTPNPQATYHAGQEIVIDVVLTAHHKGHFVYNVCPIDPNQFPMESPSQACFNENPLEFVEDLLYGAPKDSNFPERAYVAPLSHPLAVTDNSGVSGMKFSHKFKLPDNVTGNLVLLQWHWLTANSCVHEGYAEYPFPSNTWRADNLGICDPIPPDGNGVPEQFWNCAEIVIVPNGPTYPTVLPSPPLNSAPNVVPTAPVTVPTALPPTPHPQVFTPVPIPNPTATPVASPFYPTAPVTSGPGTCGGGIIGNGVCSNNMCCSKWGWCGTSSDHCGGNPPPPPVEPTTTPPTTLPAPSPPSLAGHDSRLIAYLGNWEACPSAQQVDKYTHIVIAFAVSYTWSPSKNNCSPTCEIAIPPICANQANAALVQQWQAAGKKVILSFGGAGMGGSWAGDNNNCWDYCFGRETQVVNRLTYIVNEMGLDGVDIDYEYYYENNQHGRGFTKGAEAQKFLKDVTLGLRNSLPQGSELTHAPMDPDAMPGNKYYDVLVEVASSLDFLMPQYYNGVTRPAADGLSGTGIGSVSALSHYTDLVNNMFAGDATKIVFGFCIFDCSGTGSNAAAAEAVSVLTELGKYYPCNGGGFFWVASDDTGGSWSNAVSNVIQPHAGCSNAPTVKPTTTPVAGSTPLPSTVTNSPISTPTIIPVASPTPPSVTGSPMSAPTPKPTLHSTPRPTPDLTSEPAPTSRSPAYSGPISKTRIGYYASWQWYDRGGKAKPGNIDFTKIDRVNFAFFKIDTAGNIWGTDSWADPQILFGPQNWNPQPGDPTWCSWDGPTTRSCKAHHIEQGLISLVHAAGAEIYPSLGGWTLSDAFPAMAASAEARTTFALKCVELIQDYGFDGIDIDWEYPGYAEHSGTPDDKENFNLLLDELRSKLDVLTTITGKNYGITAALPCGPSHISNIDVQHVSYVMDELNLMTYDFHGAWDLNTGTNAPIYDQGYGPAEFSVSGCVANWIESGSPKSKINIGLPFYGRSYAGASGLNEAHTGTDLGNWGIDDGVPQYFNIISKLNSMTSVRHEQTKTQYAYFNSGSGFISYDDEQAICDKTEYVIDNDLNGFIIWELSGDVMEDLSTPLMDSMNAKLADPNLVCGTPLPPPTPTPPTLAPPTGTQAPAIITTPAPAPAPTLPSDTCCPAGYTGLQPHDSCNKYYHCVRGVVTGGILACSLGTLFDIGMQNCNWADQVTCGPDPCSNEPPPAPTFTHNTPEPTKSPVTAPTSSPVTETPTPDPTSNPTTAPVADPTTTPVVAPTHSPVTDSPTSDSTSNPTTAPVADPTISPVTESPTSDPTLEPPSGPSDPCCPAGYTGLQPYDSCTKYYHCVGGVVTGGTLSCSAGTSFDEKLQICNWVAQVTCGPDPCSNRPPPPTPSPVAPTATPTKCCPFGYSGLRSFDNCSSFYHCSGGTVISEPIPCAAGTLFDARIQNCNWKAQVTCGDESCS